MGNSRFTFDKGSARRLAKQAARKQVTGYQQLFDESSPRPRG
ncbi:hypothetical protein [Kitasatospora sp. NPDC006786]